MRLPSGIVTFVFSDIEGSTRLWEQYPEQMGAALARHTALIKEALQERHGGVLFKTAGDSCCAAFDSAPAALAAALDAQRALLAEDFSAVGSLRVRMALHTGPAQVQEDPPDYFGAALSRAERLLRIGRGGQVLLSEAAV
ncbi:MAG TPA: adenylate/guanylate cyclase domain-containing protein, partial [Chthonomonadaceae bacterium]|nr:adenylate/guanylate cyclase domain-containing protein [Chthonomonadaceae bacterium]